MIEILATGALTTVQDLGRTGYLAIGVGTAGAMDPLALRLANALIGNADDAAGLEVSLFPFKMRCHGPVALAVAGTPCPATLDGHPLPPVWCRMARAGSILTLDPPPAGGRAIIAFGGGLDVPLVLGSRATDLKGGFGGLDGRVLRPGDRLALLPAPQRYGQPWDRGFGAHLPCLDDRAGADGTIRLRVLPAAEYDGFDAAARERFTKTPWRIGAAANRQGYRLSGPELTMTRRPELLSHGVRPGVVQVPADGQPIIQLADANTCGGYPKLATVIEADLWKCAHTGSGGAIRFEMTTPAEAVAALREQDAAVASVRAAVSRLRQNGD